jgi:hypothetical protein
MIGRHLIRNFLLAAIPLQTFAMAALGQALTSGNILPPCLSLYTLGGNSGYDDRSIVNRVLLRLGELFNSRP